MKWRHVHANEELVVKISRLKVLWFLICVFLDCTQAIGIGGGEIPDNDISASTSYDDLSLGARGRLNIKYQPPQKSGWCARVNDRNQYLQIDLGKTMNYGWVH